MVKGNTLKIYVLISFICHGLKAYTPSGYQGCYRLKKADIKHLNHEIFNTNTGENCKRRCNDNSEDFRYAATGGNRGQFCGCFDNLNNYERAQGDECDSMCPGSSGEICGGKLSMSVYDTWLCGTVPCKNNGSCRDISSNTYKCTCIFGWTGTNCTAYTPSGYQGCYRLKKADIKHLNHEIFNTNTGENCKRRCNDNSEDFRYAATGGNRGQFCGCFDNLNNYEHAQGDECDSMCPGSSGEICGGKLSMSVYDTWLCETVPCKNNGSCRDISSNTYKCTCRFGWTGTNCTEQKKGSSIAVYISVPAVIVIVGTCIVTVTALLIYRWRHQKNTPYSTRLRKDSTQVQTTSAMVNQAYTGHINRDETSPQYSNEHLNISQDHYSEIQPDTLKPEEQIQCNNEYKTIDLQNKSQTASHNYSHLKSQSNGFIDKTYSHVVEKDCENINSWSAISACANVSTIQMISNKILSTSDGNYNKLLTFKSQAVRTQNVHADVGDDSVYDHAVAGGDDPKIKQTDDYSHLHEVICNKSEQNSTNETPGVLKDYAYPEARLNDSDDLENVVGKTPHYFILEPCINDSADVGKERLPFGGKNDAFDAYTYNKENNSHEYFILQKETL